MLADLADIEKKEIWKLRTAKQPVGANNLAGV